MDEQFPYGKAAPSFDCDDVMSCWLLARIMRHLFPSQNTRTKPDSNLLSGVQRMIIECNQYMCFAEFQYLCAMIRAHLTAVMESNSVSDTVCAKWSKIPASERESFLEIQCHSLFFKRNEAATDVCYQLRRCVCSPAASKPRLRRQCRRAHVPSLRC